MSKKNESLSKVQSIKIGNVLERITNGNSIKDACHGIVSRTTFYKWLKSPKNFKEYASIIENMTISVTDSLYQNAISGNVTAQIFWLKNRSPERWSEKSDIRHSGEIDNRIQITFR